jgi:hypothetical protein
VGLVYIMSKFARVIIKYAGSAKMRHMANNLLTSTYEQVVAIFVVRYRNLTHERHGGACLASS